MELKKEDKVKYIALIIDEEFDNEHTYSSRVRVLTKVYGPYDTYDEALNKAYPDGEVITTVNGEPDDYPENFYGHAE